MQQAEHLMEQMTTDQGMKFLESQAWEHLSPRERAGFQLLQDRLWMPSSVFQQAVEEALDRTVETTEIGINRHGLISELLQDNPPPTLQDVLDNMATHNPDRPNSRDDPE